MIVLYGDQGTAAFILSGSSSVCSCPAVFPLVMFTGDRAKMGVCGPLWVKLLAWTVAVVIAALNVCCCIKRSRGGSAAGIDALENSAADRTSSACHSTGRLTGAELLLVHVADGWAARNFDQLRLRESEEMKADRLYLHQVREDLAGQALTVQGELGMGDPATERIRTAETNNVDLIAMSTHGHRFLADVLHGTTADRVRHLVKVPGLLLRAQEI